MRIAVDLLAMLSPESKNRGIGIYATDMLKTLFRLDTKNEYFLFNLLEDIDLQAKLNYGKNVQADYFEIAALSTLRNDPNFKDIIGRVYQSFVRDHAIDYFFLTSPFDTFIDYQAEWFQETKLMGVVYDLIPLVLSDIYLKDRNAKRAYLQRLEFVKKFEHYFAISNSVKHDLHQYAGISPNKVTTIFSGISTIYQTKDYTVTEVDSTMKKYGVFGEYIMMTGGDDERKNIGPLIEAYAMLPEDLKKRYMLVIVCKISTYSLARYGDLASSKQVKDRVVFTNFVPYEDLVLFYNRASLMAFPSLYEGFGLPVVEAMACNTLVVTSLGSSLEEIAKEAAVLVDPKSVSSIAKGMEEALRLSSEKRSNLIKNGHNLVRKYTWNNAVRFLLAGLSTLSDDQTPMIISEKRLKLAMFTPLPPIRSGISDYSVDIIRALTKYYDIDVFIDNYTAITDDMPASVKIYRHDEFPSKAKSYQSVIYQVGNNMFHNYLIPYLQKYPGIVELHDVNLSGLVLNMTLAKNDYKQYAEILYYDFDKSIVDAYVEELKNGKSSVRENEFSVNGFLTKYATQIIVHSNYAKEQILHRHYGFDVLEIPLYASQIDNPLKPFEAKMIHRIDSESTVFAVFGYASAPKRIVPIFQAFSRIAKKDAKTKLFIVGEMSENVRNQTRTIIQEHKLEQRVVLKGFTTLDDFSSLIDACDIAINLRYPYYGESSASLSRLLGAGKAVIVSDIGSFSEYPDNTVMKLPVPEGDSVLDEVATIERAMWMLMRDHSKRKAMETAAYIYAKDHLQIDKIAMNYRQSIENQSLHPIFDDTKYQAVIGAIIGRDITDKKTLFGLTKTIAYTKNREGYRLVKHFEDSLEQIDVTEIMTDIRREIGDKRKKA
jgi:glycosyltransferase involved in cell wall biosynthesis